MTCILRLHQVMRLLPLAVLILGCGRQEPAVRTYQVARPPEQAAKSGADRMLVAMIDQNDRVWFFKAVGPSERVSAVADQIRRFVTDLKFNEQGSPTWELPKNWRESPGNAIRLATLTTDEPSSIEISVTSLPAPQDVLDNVNRWRNQLGLDPIGPAQLKTTSESLRGDGFEATWVDLAGTFSANMGRPPFASAARAPARSEPENRSTSARETGPASSQTAESPLSSATVAETWQPGAVSAMRKAAYQVEEGEQSAEITVITLSAAGGALLPNVNRWRGQVGLEPLNEDELQAELTQLTAGTVQGDYVKMEGEVEGRPTTLLAVTILHDGQAWFFKMMGDTDLVNDQREAFERFVQSTSF